MKQKILLICLPVIMLLLPVKIFSQSFPSDTLLFDGGNGKIYKEGSCYCKAKVISYSGEAYGTRIIKEVYEVCGGKDSSDKLVKGGLHLGDMLYVGDDDPIETKEGTLKIQLEGGEIFALNPNTKITIRANYCCNKYSGGWIKLSKGLLCYDAKQLYPEKDKNLLICETNKTKMEIYHTIFTVCATDETDIVKVYDGKVKVSLLHPPQQNNDNIQEKMKQLMDDFKAGKISAEEVGNKMKEFNE